MTSRLRGRTTLAACGIALLIGSGLTGCGKNTGTEMPKTVSAPPADKPANNTVMGTNSEPEK